MHMYLLVLEAKKEMKWNQFNPFLWKAFLFYWKREVTPILWGVMCVCWWLRMNALKYIYSIYNWDTDLSFSQLESNQSAATLIID